ncbi:MAG: hypothetical protein ACREBW_01685, partial [Candidatus Micrarchaeaceae archaeon]
TGSHEVEGSNPSRSTNSVIPLQGHANFHDSSQAWQNAPYLCQPRRRRNRAGEYPLGSSVRQVRREAKVKVPTKVKNVRGKPSVPRERFHLRGKAQYLWAGLQFCE